MWKESALMNTFMHEQYTNPMLFILTVVLQQM